jgi:hypothetical protein
MKMSAILRAAFMSAAMLMTGVAHAMDIKDYFRMATPDQGRFDQTLLDGAEKALRDEGRPESRSQAGQDKREAKNPNLPHSHVAKSPFGQLFTPTDDTISEGMKGYTINLADMLKAELATASNSFGRGMP